MVFGQEQPTLQTNNQQQYILGGIELSGDHTIDKKSILKLMDLSIGQKINLGGEDIKKGLKTLWGQGLFSDIQISKKHKDEKAIILYIYLETANSLLKFKFNGIKKGEEENIRKEIAFYPGMTITPNVILISTQKIENYFIDKGFPNIYCDVQSIPDSMNHRKVTLEFNVNKNARVKIKEINFIGNKNIKSSKLKKVMKETRETGLRYLLSTSKLIADNYQQDLNNVIDLYKQKGYRDAFIVKEDVEIIEEDRIVLNIEISEGEQYFFGDIQWLGNTKYDSNTLSEILGIQYGDIFDETLLDSRLNMSQNGDDISALYMDDGYLFFQVNPVEIKIDDNNFIHLEMQMREGTQATIKNVTITGNTKTNDHVIIREVRSLPGQLFKRSDIIRTQEEFNRLGFFNPETLGVNPIPDPNTGDVDIHYTVEEKPADQIELQGGWGNGMFVGSFGVSFSNFSTRGIFDKTTWDPLPTGDGQKLRLRAQSNGSYYQNYSISFEEPWLGGKKPNAFSIALWKSVQSFTEGSSMQILGASVGLGKRIKWPDDYFTIQNSFNVLRYQLEDYQTSLFNFSNGFSNNINYSISINRNSIFNPIYPRYGSRFSLSLELTPPYSLFSDKDYNTMTDQEKFKFLEYKKIKAQGTWFSAITGDLVLKTHFEFGFLSAYNEELGLPPFERFFVGGDGLSGYSIDGRELVSLRGYPNSSLSANDGSPIYGKSNIELRYPISLNPSSTIYALCFAETGNSWMSIDDFNPFEMKRSLGLGIRIFMPMFGVLGVDFGHGFDNIPGYNTKSGWQTHFTIGQQF